MKIQFIPNNKDSINYPVGIHIYEAITFINNVIKIIDKDKAFPTNNIAIWCRGSSGAILAALLSQQLLLKRFNVKINHVKKNNEYSHTSNYFRVSITNIIIDDFIASGETIREITKCMKVNEVSQIDYLITSNTNLVYDDDDKVIGLSYPTPVNLIISKTGVLTKVAKILRTLEPTNLRTYNA